MRPIAQNRPFTAHHSPFIVQRSSFNAHRSPLIVQKSVSYVLMSNPFGAICVNKKPRTLHADVPTPSQLIAQEPVPSVLLSKNTQNCTQKSLKTALKTVLYTPVQLPPPPIKYLIICYLILYTFVHCFPLSFLALILILQRKSLRTNKKNLFYDKENISLNLPSWHVCAWSSGASLHTRTCVSPHNGRR